MSFVFVGLHVFIYLTLSPYGRNGKSSLMVRLLQNFHSIFSQKKNKRNIKILVKTKDEKLYEKQQEKKNTERCRNIVIRIIYALSPDGDPILIDKVEYGSVLHISFNGFMKK